jgi:hypothetical protein
MTEKRAKRPSARFIRPALVPVDTSSIEVVSIDEVSTSNPDIVQTPKRAKRPSARRSLTAATN